MEETTVLSLDGCIQRVPLPPEIASAAFGLMDRLSQDSALSVCQDSAPSVSFMAWCEPCCIPWLAFSQSGDATPFSCMLEGKITARKAVVLSDEDLRKFQKTAMVEFRLVHLP
jgi:hypothetical protein